MPIKAGVVGLRRGASLASVLAHQRDAQLIVLADRDRPLAERQAAALRVPHHEGEFDDVLRYDLDALVIATPAPDHAEQCILALKAGMHVLCEVPAAWTLDECRQLVRAVQGSGRKYMLAENACYFPRTLAWKRAIDEGRLGAIFYAEAEYVHNCQSIMRDADGHPTWRASMPPIHYCTHSIGPLVYWTGDRCVSACGLNSGCHVAPDLGAVDMEVGIFRTAGGGVWKCLCGFSVQREPGCHYYCLYGTKGMVESARAPWDADKAYFANDPATAGPARSTLEPPELPAPPEAGLGGHGDAEWFMVADFLACIREDTPSPIDVYTAMDYTAPGLCAHLSAQQGGKPIEVPDFRPGA
jgi:predicted dehydrogenase